MEAKRLAPGLASIVFAMVGGDLSPGAILELARAGTRDIENGLSLEAMSGHGAEIVRCSSAWGA